MRYLFQSFSSSGISANILILHSHVSNTQTRIAHNLFFSFKIRRKGELLTLLNKDYNYIMSFRVSPTTIYKAVKTKQTGRCWRGVGQMPKDRTLCPWEQLKNCRHAIIVFCWVFCLLFFKVNKQRQNMIVLFWWIRVDEDSGTKIFHA